MVWAAERSEQCDGEFGLVERDRTLLAQVTLEPAHCEA